MNFIVFEHVEKRTKNSKTYRMHSGELQTHIYMSDIHYEDEFDNLQNIDTNLDDESDFDELEYEKPVSKHSRDKFIEIKEKVKVDKKKGRLDRDKHDFQGLRVPFRCKIPKKFSKGYSIGKGENELTFIPIGVSNAKGDRNDDDRSLIEYQDPWNDVDVTLQITFSGIKETIILKTDKAPAKFTFEVKGDIQAYKLHDSWLIDNKGEKRDVSQAIREEGTKTYIELTADVSGLEFPVKIDPTVTIQPDNSTGVDTYVASEAATSSFGNENIIITGGYDYGQYRRAYLKFDLASISGPISSAVLTLRCIDYGESASRTISIFKLLSAFSESTTWDGKPTEDTTLITSGFVSTANDYNFTITSLAEAWRNGSITNYGIVLRGYDQYVGYKGFASSEHATASYRPKLTITYNQPPSAPAVTAPNGGETWNAQHTITWNAATDSETVQGSLQYNIQLSTDNGATYPTTIVALTSAGATSLDYDFSAIPQTSTAKIRIRAYDGSSYGAWDESNGVFTIQHNQAPAASTNLSPDSGTAQNRAATIRLSWQHNDPNSDPQSKFDLQYSTNDGSSWTTVTQTTTDQYYDVPANTFAHGNVLWKIRTYDQADLSGPYSAQATFLAGDKPATPTITAPLVSTALARPTVTWSSSGQTDYQLIVKEGETAVYDTGTVTSTNKAQTIAYDLANGTNYTIELRIKNADGLWSDYDTEAIAVSYTPPATPTTELTDGTGYINIAITNPTPEGTQPTVTSSDVYRRVLGGTWERVQTGATTAYKDYAVASDVTYEYKVRAQGDNGTYADSEASSNSITFTGVWLHDVLDPAGTIHNFKYDGKGRSETWQASGTMMQFAGRTSPVVEFGESEDNLVNVQLQMLPTSTDFEALKALVKSKATLCYRDGRGRKMFGVVMQLPITDDAIKSYSTSIRVTKTAYSEVV